jgi:thioredoxin 1
MSEIPYLDNLNSLNVITNSLSNINKLIVLDFTASWCAPCQALVPHLNNMNSKYPNVLFYKIDVDNEDHSDTLNIYSISAMPTVILIRNRETVSSLVGANPTDIENKILQYQ